MRVYKNRIKTDVWARSFWNFEKEDNIFFRNSSIAALIISLSDMDGTTKMYAGKSVAKSYRLSVLQFERSTNSTRDPIIFRSMFTHIPFTEW